MNSVMSRVLRSLFSLRGRIGRFSYLARIIVLKFLAGLFIWSWFNAGLPLYDAWILPHVLVVVVTFALAYSFSARRLNDLDQIGWLVGLLVLVPVLGALVLVVPLLFFRGSDGKNRYG